MSIPRPAALASGFGAIWAQSRADGSLWRVAQDGEVQARIPDVIAQASLRQPIAVAFGSVWTLARGSVNRIDGSTNRVVARVSVDPTAVAIVAGLSAVWVGTNRGGLIRIDPATNSARIFKRVGVSPGGLGVGDGAVWWINFSERASIDRIDVGTGQVIEIPTGVYSGFVVPTPRWVWAIQDGAASRIDPWTPPYASEPRRPVRKARASLGVTYSHGTVWINDGNLVGFDADTGRVTARYHASGHQSWQAVAGIAILGSDAWLVDPGGGRIVRVNPA